MPLCHYRSAGESGSRLGWITGDRVVPVATAAGPVTLADCLGMSASRLFELLHGLTAGPDAAALDSVTLTKPIDQQEVWAAGVTYLRSRDARMEESQEKSVYDRVYEAERPEIFMKATPNRVVGPGEAIAVRHDSTWDVPEPEFALCINAGGEIVGYTVGNDVSSRSIEGENPLYLPQAKVYRQCAALGPVIVMNWEMADRTKCPITLVIRRGGAELFRGTSSTDQMHRTFDDLAAWLFRDNDFAAGVFLMTGTGIVPPSEFTLEGGDEVEIQIDGIGTLVNPVVRLA